jgi:phosphate-selective porin OprO and OprP
MRSTQITAVAALLLPVLYCVSPAAADGYKISDGDKFLEVGARMQLLYSVDDPADGPKTDDLYFSHLRVRVEGSSHPDWMGKVEWNFGGTDTDNDISLQESWMQYSGWKNLKLRIGNSAFPFSRDLVTSYYKQQLANRTFVGDVKYGTPAKNTGFHLYGNNDRKSVTWRASATIALIKPDNSKLHFGTPVNKPSSGGYNEGFMVGGRVDYHPFGYLPFAQGDFTGKTKATIGLGAYNWNNDGDVATTGTAADVDSVNAFEISGAFRSHGFSVDLQYNTFDVETVQPGVTDGIYKNGQTILTNAAIEGGYMIRNSVEIVACYQLQDADGYSTQWTRTTLGVNWYINGLDTKMLFNYRMGENLDGVPGNDENQVFVQGQFLF